MAIDEFEKIETYVRDLAALSNYPQVKEERDSLVGEALQLKRKVVQLEAQLSTEISAKNELSSQLSKVETEANERAGKLDATQKELASLKEFKMKLPDAGELTLEEMKDQFLHAEQDEIERRIKQRYRAIGKDVGRRMPALVHKRLVRVLRQPTWPPEIADVIDARARQTTEGTLHSRDKWPDWFKNYYLEEVNTLVSQRLTGEFERRVQIETERRLELVKKGQWQEYVASKTRTLTSCLKDMFKELQGTWRLTCDRCSRTITVNLSVLDIGLLLRAKTIDVTCTTCLDPAPFPFVLSTVQHKITSLSLEFLLTSYWGALPP